MMESLVTGRRRILITSLPMMGKLRRKLTLAKADVEQYKTVEFFDGTAIKVLKRKWF
jgi:hypothetical protein